MVAFTNLPQDMLQHEINHYLDPVSRMNWNEVLKADERVYKKLPADYAIKHHLLVSHAAYESIANKLTFSLGRVADGWPQHVPKSVKLLKKYFAWFRDPVNCIALMYTTGLKDRFVEEIRQWSEDDTDLYDVLCRDTVNELRDEALKTHAAIEKVPFVRHVITKGHKSAFAY
jgi:hypothetical protein